MEGIIFFSAYIELKVVLKSIEMFSRVLNCKDSFDIYLRNRKSYANGFFI